MSKNKFLSCVGKHARAGVALGLSLFLCFGLAACAAPSANQPTAEASAQPVNPTAVDTSAPEPVAPAEVSAQPSDMPEASAPPSDTPADVAPDTAEGAGCDTPQEAAMAYVDAFQAGDLSRMIGAFAVESYAKNYDFGAMLERIRAYSPGLDMKLPNANELATSLNVESRRSDVSNMIMRQYILLSSFEYDLTAVLPLEDEAAAAEFTAQFSEALNAPKLDTLKVLGFIPPEDLSEVYLAPQNTENIAKQAKVYGADKIESVAMAFELNGEKYILCLDAINYGGKWRISQMGGNIGALMSIDTFSAGVMPLMEYESLVQPMQ